MGLLSARSTERRSSKLALPSTRSGQEYGYPIWRVLKTLVKFDAVFFLEAPSAERNNS
jgi:hypothetical protein